MDLHWQQMGNGPATMVAVHCSLAHGRVWSGLADALAGAARIDACDLPGHGRSPDWDAAMGEYQGVAAAAVTAHIAGMPEPVHLIGHSFGGTVALRVAVDDPSRIASLTLIEPVLFAAAFQANPASRAAFDTVFAGFTDAYQRGDLTEATRAFTTLWGGGPPWEDLPDVQRKALISRIHLIPAQNPGIMHDVGGILAPGRLEGLECPVRLIEGANSPVVISQIQQALLARRPAAVRTVIPDAGHMVPLTHPSEVAKHLRAMLPEAEIQGRA